MTKMYNDFKADTPIGASIKNLMTAFFSGDSANKNEYYAAMGDRARSQAELDRAKTSGERAQTTGRADFGSAIADQFAKLGSAGQIGAPELAGGIPAPGGMAPYGVRDTAGPVASAVAATGGNAAQIADGWRTAMAVMEALNGGQRNALVLQGKEPSEDAAFTDAQADAVSARNAGESQRESALVQQIRNAGALAVQRAKPASVSEDQILVDPVTGETLATGLRSGYTLGGNQTRFDADGNPVSAGPIVLSDGQQYQTGPDAPVTENEKTAGNEPLVTAWDTVNQREVRIPRSAFDPNVHRASRPVDITKVRPEEINSGISGALGFPTADGTIDGEIDTAVADVFRFALQNVLNAGLAPDVQAAYPAARRFIDPYLDVSDRFGRSDVQFKDGLDGNPTDLVSAAIRQATGGQSAPTAPAASAPAVQPTEAHIQALRSNASRPGIKEEFDRKFGSGAAAAILGPA